MEQDRPFDPTIMQRRSFLQSTAKGAAAVALGIAGCDEAGGPNSGGSASGGSSGGGKSGGHSVGGSAAGTGAEFSSASGGDGGSAGGTGGGGAGPTPACLETEDNALGPAYLPGAPLRPDGNLNVLHWEGTPLLITGQVFDFDCKTPLVGAEVDLWQADDSGCYNGSPIGCVELDGAWPLRGRVITDEEGRYLVSTLLPGLYPGRTRHIHAIIRMAGYKDLTTQIYFEGEARNASDGLIEPELIIPLAEAPDGTLSGVFDVVLGK
jgi:protocatechuate 3,4-dioxygenase beta subunit